MPKILKTPAFESNSETKIYIVIVDSVRYSVEANSAEEAQNKIKELLNPTTNPEK